MTPNDTTVVLRIPQELKDALQIEAEELDVSLSEVIRTKLMIAQQAVHREPVIRLGSESYRLWDVLRADILDYNLVSSRSGPSYPETLLDEQGRHDASLTGAYSDAVHQAIAAAREQAITLGSPEITPIHMALGLLRIGDCNAIRIIGLLTQNLSDVVHALENGIVIKPSKRRDANRNIALTRASEKRLKLLYLEAKLDHHDVAESQHLLLAILRDADDAVTILNGFGVTYDAVRKAIKRM